MPVMEMRRGVMKDPDEVGVKEDELSSIAVHLVSIERLLRLFRSPNGRHCLMIDGFSESFGDGVDPVVKASRSVFDFWLLFFSFLNVGSRCWSAVPVTM